MTDHWELIKHEDWTWTARHRLGEQANWNFDDTESLMDFLREIL